MFHLYFNHQNEDLKSRTKVKMNIFQHLKTTDDQQGLNIKLFEIFHQFFHTGARTRSGKHWDMEL